jgi:hypothetical protein
MRRTIFDPYILIYGLASWAIPFAASLFFFAPGGRMLVPRELFESVMIVVGGGSASLLLVLAFLRAQATVTRGFSIGVLWLAINLGLDLWVLLPISKMGIGEYFQEIGLRYLLIPVMSVGMAAVALPYRRALKARDSLLTSEPS